MKFLISVEPNPERQPPLEQLPQLLRAQADVLRSQLQSGKLDCVYSTGQGSGFGIAEAASVEQVWERIAENPFALFWRIAVTALGDPIALTEIQVRMVTASQPVGAASRN
ncbi:MAG: hypothetical protein HUU14_12090 [Dehalococcoidia bacterium]|nr:MAG: hypothetical protein EDM76_09540 [bacterium]MCK6563138.1 hypothetical protein [Dehalococcoidia bacterium]MCL4232453.1 hypothetical protein [Dehalococcoidia bacterium]NUQ56620.1 hypothetical protein [Dehalococcoidia bacterium]